MIVPGADLKSALGRKLPRNRPPPKNWQFVPPISNHQSKWIHPTWRSAFGCGKFTQMDEATLAVCLEHLEAADILMDPGADGWHRARLSHVIEGLKEAYGPCPSQAAP